MNLLFVGVAVAFLWWGLMGVLGRFRPSADRGAAIVLKGGRLPGEDDRLRFIASGMAALLVFILLAAWEAAR